MATDVAETPAPLPAEAPPRPRARGTLYFGRFYLVYVVLGLVVCAAVVGGVIAARSGGGSAGGQAWSTWRPGGGGLGLAQQIASHVGGEYRLGDGTQLAAVVASAPVVSLAGHDYSVGTVAIHGGRNVSDTVASISRSNTVLYKVCGYGTSCSFATGTPTAARSRLVRREIVELALYTFHYESAIDNVIAFMPPASSTTQPVMVFLQRADFGSRLSEPLSRTLSPQTPTASKMSPSDRAAVDELTGTRSYSWSFQQAQDGNAIFVLRKLRA